jgi:hypothetical protein
MRARPNLTKLFLGMRPRPSVEYGKSEHQGEPWKPEQKVKTRMHEFAHFLVVLYSFFVCAHCLTGFQSLLTKRQWNALNGLWPLFKRFQKIIEVVLT